MSTICPRLKMGQYSASKSEELNLQVFRKVPLAVFLIFRLKINSGVIDIIITAKFTGKQNKYVWKL